MATTEAGNEGTEYEEPAAVAAQTLRSSCPDLVVVVEYKNDNGEATEKSYAMYSAVLAKLSKFVDASLSVEMKEKETKKIVFRDISPELFELALQYQEDFVAARKLTAEDAVKVVGFYDKYDFEGGLQLCDHVLSEMLQKKYYETVDLSHPPEDLDFIVDVIELAAQLELKQAKECGIAFLESKFYPQCSGFNPTMFSVDHMKKLHPLFKRGEVKLLFGASMTKEELESPLFPKYYVSYISSNYAGIELTVIELSGTWPEIDGHFHKSFNGGYQKPLLPFMEGRWIDGQEYHFCIEKSNTYEGDWAIAGDIHLDSDGGDDDIVDIADHGGERIVFWKSPFSRNLRYPPKEHWLPVHQRVLGKEFCPKLKYIKAG